MGQMDLEIRNVKWLKLQDFIVKSLLFLALKWLAVALYLSLAPLVQCPEHLLPTARPDHREVHCAIREVGVG